MRIGILGTRGIPNNYGGFEQFAQYLSLGLKEKGCDVYVYNSHDHPYKESNWQGINIIHCFDPEYIVGLSGQFVYDLNCVLDSRRRSFDVILQLGYTTSSVWGWLFPRRCSVVYNMDGMEWWRSKYNGFIKRFLKRAERLAVRHSDSIIADSEVIYDYFTENFDKNTVFIPYGADIFSTPSEAALTVFDLKPFSYNIIIARLQPDNNTEMILDGVVRANDERLMLVIGKDTSPYGRYLKEKYKSEKIRFFGGIYDINILNNLRYFSHLYFHGHSAGGTNPSLLEAMASSGLICAFDGPFNKAVLGENAFYFGSSDDVVDLLDKDFLKSDYDRVIKDNLQVIEQRYNWQKIIDDYYYCLSENMKARSD